MKNSANIMGLLPRLDGLCTAGYAIALHISYTTPRFLFQTYAKDWMQVYSEKGLVLKDPTVLWGFSNTGVARWGDLEDIDHDGLLPLAREYGLKHGFTFAVDDTAGKSITSFARNDRDFSDDEVSEISEIVLDLHGRTADVDEFSADELALLKKLSVEFTRGPD